MYYKAILKRKEYFLHHYGVMKGSYLYWKSLITSIFFLGLQIEESISKYLHLVMKVKSYHMRSYDVCLLEVVIEFKTCEYYCGLKQKN